MPVSAGFIDKANARLDGRLDSAGFDAAMQAALAQELVLAADETPVNVLTPDTDPGTGEVVPGAAQVMVIRTPAEKLVWLTALSSRRAEGITALLAFFAGFLIVDGYTLGRWCRIRGYLDSAANHGLTALDAISAALAGSPWLPAAPAAA